MAQGIKSSSYRRPKSDDNDIRSDDEVELTYFEQIQAIAYRHARDRQGESNTRRFLMLWWAEYYNRPLKDPLLLSYSVEELAYEYYIIHERAAAKNEQAEAIADKIEEEAYAEDMAWADEEERLEQEAETKVESKPEKKYDPLKDPKQVEWMEEEMKKNKILFGDDFGEDINVDFDKE